MTANCSDRRRHWIAAMAFSACLFAWLPPAQAGQYRQSEIQAAITALGSPVADIKRHAAMKLGTMGRESKDAVPALIEALSDPDPGIKDEVADALGKIGPLAKAAVPALVAFLQDTSIEVVRSQAALALANIGPDAAPAIPALIKALSDPDPAVRQVSARALGDLGVVSRAAVPALISVLDSDDRLFRQNACMAVLEIGLDEKDIKDMIPRLSDEIDCIRSCAARSLGALGPSAAAAIPALTKLTDDPSVYVRLDATTALMRIDKNSKLTLTAKDKDLLNDYGDTPGLWLSEWSTMR
jgi:HEAT repeat protein